jgi:hypothetical protein
VAVVVPVEKPGRVAAAVVRYCKSPTCQLDHQGVGSSPAALSLLLLARVVPVAPQRKVPEHLVVRVA